MTQNFTRRTVLKGIAAGAAASALGFPAIVRGQGAKLKVGLMLPYSGTFSIYGESITNSFRMAMQESGTPRCAQRFSNAATLPFWSLNSTTSSFRILRPSGLSPGLLPSSLLQAAIYQSFRMNMSAPRGKEACCENQHYYSECMHSAMQSARCSAQYRWQRRAKRLAFINRRST